MILRRPGIALAAFVALSSRASALPENWHLNFQPPASPIMQEIADFHRLLLYIIVAISLFVLGLLLWIVVRYNKRANPVPS
ncbi:MAG: cytochrome C oxidase subunit II, partial [Alphaproteobacteria bacterium]|nr:cytochrome C oxidase subunit II [Alphaproteobacteria bacterium]